MRTECTSARLSPIKLPRMLMILRAWVIAVSKALCSQSHMTSFVRLTKPTRLSVV